MSYPHTDNSKERTNEANIPDTKETRNESRFLIPDCCREGWSTCEHVVKPEPKKYNLNII